MNPYRTREAMIERLEKDTNDAITAMVNAIGLANTDAGEKWTDDAMAHLYGCAQRKMILDDKVRFASFVRFAESMEARSDEMDDDYTRDDALAFAVSPFAVGEFIKAGYDANKTKAAIEHLLDKLDAAYQACFPPAGGGAPTPPPVSDN